MNVEIFYKTPKDLEKAVGYVSTTTGEYLPLKMTDKRVIVYLLDRLNFFVGKLGGEHFESQATIAKALGLEYQAIGKCLRSLIAHGFVDAELKKPKVGKTRWFYNAVNTDVMLWVGNVKSPVLLDKEGNPATTFSKAPALQVTAPKLTKYVHVEEEDFDSPF